MIQLRRRHARCAAWSLLLCVPAFARDPPPAGRVFHHAACYSAFAPRTALDMINQTPGYEPDRNGVLAFREVSSFRPGIWWMLTLSGSF